MDRFDLFSMLCGFLAMSVAAVAAMALGYEGMSFARPWPGLASCAVLVEVLLMRWLGPGPGMLLMAPLMPLGKRWPKVELLGVSLFFLCIPATAIGLAFVLLGLMRRVVH
jgi:hypothetical protein